eukprot:Rhum_TRINITY_DN6244_c0_g1::Rhum_TRINITY_DN6244_c0_g1_i1::g.19503::m.19503/K00547/mmuM, BHMT2; homocysteine S-methyltransferase
MPSFDELFEAAAAALQAQGPSRAPSCQPASRSTRCDPFAPLLQARGVVLLDGGMARTLEEELGRPLDATLWTAEALLGDEDALGRVHRRYSEAGCDVGTTASYQVGYPALRTRGLRTDAVDALLAKSIAVARDAGAAVVAASIGPLAATFADGSEYSPAYAAEGCAAAEKLVRYHKAKLDALCAASPPPDCVAFETVGCAAEAAAILAVLQAAVYPAAWVSFVCSSGGCLASGERLGDIAAALLRRDDGARTVAAVGINCTKPCDVPQALAAVVPAAARSDVHVVCYPNSGQEWSHDKQEWVDATGATDQEFARLCVEWYHAGARLIGGCCQTTPATMRLVAQELACAIRAQG